MAEADWSDLTGSGALTDVNQGVSTAFTPPVGGSSFVYGFHQTGTAAGVIGKYCNLANFAPMSGTKKGGRITAAMKRYTANLGYSPFIALALGKDVNTTQAYILGLSNASTYHAVLKKGDLASVLDESSGSILWQETAARTSVGNVAAAWVHLCLDVLVNPHGEVILNVGINTGNVTTPTWTTMSGSPTLPYTDDSLGALTGSSPYLDQFYAIFGMQTDGVAGAMCLFDHLTVSRQIAP